MFICEGPTSGMLTGGREVEAMVSKSPLGVCCRGYRYEILIILNYIHTVEQAK